MKPFWAALQAGLVFSAGCVGPSVETDSSTSMAARTNREGVRVATYNVEFLSTFMEQDRLKNLRETVGSLDADVIAFQEVDDKAALEELLGPEWQIAVGDLSDEDQELAVAVRQPLKLGEFGLVFPESRHDRAFPNRRDVMRAAVTTPGGAEFIVYSIHFKSRQGGRRSTEGQRTEAASLLSDVIQASPKVMQIVLGDFNDAPDDRGPNILESGNDQSAPGANASERVLKNLTEPLAIQDYVTESVYEIYRDQKDFKPVAPGSLKDNARLRDQNYRYPEDVLVRPVMFDQILASPSLAKLATKVDVFAPASALRGRRGRGATMASDHLPVLADFNLK